MSAVRATTDARFGPPDFAVLPRPRPAAFNPAHDGAPRLFGTDVRLRNLMALAVHGPLWHSELRRIVGTTHQRVEDDDEAPFGRGDFVCVYDVDGERAIALNPAHPLHLPLKTLLVALARAFPLAPHRTQKKRPPAPVHRHWDGDRMALFGSPIPTLILLSLAQRHWTFEAHVCAVAADWHRENVKKAIRRLELDGILEGSRPRGPGFGPRLLRLAQDCPAHEELEILIDTAATVWEDLGERMVRAFDDDIPPKTKAYFRKRDLL